MKRLCVALVTPALLLLLPELVLRGAGYRSGQVIHLGRRFARLGVPVS